MESIVNPCCRSHAATFVKSVWLTPYRRGKLPGFEPLVVHGRALRLLALKKLLQIGFLSRRTAKNHCNPVDYGRATQLALITGHGDQRVNGTWNSLHCAGANRSRDPVSEPDSVPPKCGGRSAGEIRPALWLPRMNRSRPERGGQSENCSYTSYPRLFRAHLERSISAIGFRFQYLSDVQRMHVPTNPLP